mgnify:CR=1 FL=1
MELLLDSSIRDWVLIPILLVVFLSGMLRSVLSQMTSAGKDPEKDETMINQATTRTGRLKANYKYLPELAFRKRRSFFCTEKTGFLYKEVDSGGMPAMMDPSSQLGMLKKNAATGITTMLLLTWVGHFCSGFILARVPFPLTQKFRSMLQRGVELNALDVTYVSSSSLYFLALFGMNGVLNLVMGDRKESLSNLAMPQMAPGGKNLEKVMSSERENLELIDYKFALEQVEDYFINT